MLISLHFSKTAGTSFGKSLKEYFGTRFRRDDDYPIHQSVWQRNQKAIKLCAINTVRSFAGIDCIHGHFLPLKYFGLSVRIPTWFITWLRDPVERLASHYNFWLRMYSPNTALPLHRRVVEEGWSFEKFCFSPELRNYYHSFLWGFPLRGFAFVGITEHYIEDFVFFSDKFLTGKTPMFSENVNPERNNNQYVTNTALRRRIEAFHALDMRLYNQACELRRKRLVSSINRRVFLPPKAA